MLPEFWSFKVARSISPHRAMAAVLSAALMTGLRSKSGADPGAPLGMRCGASLLVSLLGLQILLGAAIIATYRDPAISDSATCWWGR